MKSVISRVAMLATACQLKDSRSKISQSPMKTPTATTGSGRDSHDPAFVRARLKLARMQNNGPWRARFHCRISSNSGNELAPAPGEALGPHGAYHWGDDTAGLTASCPIGSSRRLVLPNALPAFTTIQTHDLTRRAIQDRVHKGWERAARCAARAVLLLIDRFVPALCHRPSTVVLFA
jgi:hypothetical protein